MMSLIGSFWQRSNEEGYFQGKLFGLACWLITGILGLVSLYVEKQSKNLFHVYQSWIAFCIIGLFAVRSSKIKDQVLNEFQGRYSFRFDYSEPCL